MHYQRLGIAESRRRDAPILARTQMGERPLNHVLEHGWHKPVEGASQGRLPTLCVPHLARVRTRSHTDPDQVESLYKKALLTRLPFGYNAN